MAMICVHLYLCVVNVHVRSECAHWILWGRGMHACVVMWTVGKAQTWGGIC